MAYRNLLCVVSLAFATQLSAAGVEFNRDVRPILSDRCFFCHGPDGNNRKANLRLDTEEGATTARGKKTPVVPGKSAASEVYLRITTDNKGLRMPPAYAGHAKLTDKEIAIIKQWIDEGAVFQKHWSFVAPTRPTPPVTANTQWVRNPIDAFVLEQLDRRGLKPTGPASRETLLRRVTFDLTGLPPTPEELRAFTNDTSSNAYEKVVDRLLASPRYAERMAIRWLEAARYADTNGYQSDGPRDMWRWRDWVLEAFNKNMPFDQFTIEQLAGDLLPNATLSQKIATAFHRNHRTSAEGGIVDEEFRTEYVADRAETTSTVWLGLTMNCTRCHDHKYDPLKQKDFYSLFAFFNQVPERGFVYNFGNEEPYIKAPLPEQQRKLDEFDAKITAARTHLTKLDPLSAKSQSKWEKGLKKAAPLEWNIADGLVYHQPLDNGAPGKVGTARHFDNKEFFETPDKTTAKFNFRDPFTFAAWINPESPKGAILSRADDYFEGEGHALYLLEGKIRLHVVFRWTDLGMRLETAEPVKMNEWQHVLVTYDGGMKASGVHIYVNGEERKLKILFDQCIWPLDPKVPFRIGAGGGLRFQGSIDDVRVYNRALSADEAKVVAMLGPVNALAAIKPAQRTKVQADKLHLCFLDKFAPAAINDARKNLRAAQAERDKFYDTVPTVMVMKDRDTPRDTFILKRGAYDAPGEKVTAAVPGFLPPLPADAPRNRLGLARWIVSRENPLTARVTVNRYWQMLFGLGIVKTSEDFGSQGEQPAHQALLDWLAVEFMDSGWNVKHILKTIVTSNTYQQASRVTPELMEKDPENRLYARGPRQRLAPEMVRDQALAVSGLLVEKVGGPSVKPYQPAGLWGELAGGAEYKHDAGDGLYRRSLYTYWRRTIAPPTMVNFDSPTRETCVVRESRTNTPLQALNLMNDVTYVEASRHFAENILKRPAEQRLSYAFETALARNPKPRETAVLNKALDKFRSRYSANPESATKIITQGESKPDSALDPVELASWTGVASLILNLDEAITKE